MPVLFRATPWQDLTNGRFVHKPTTVVAGHSRDTPVRPSTLRTTDAPRTHPPSGQSVLARPAAALRRHRADSAKSVLGMPMTRLRGNPMPGSLLGIGATSDGPILIGAG